MQIEGNAFNGSAIKEIFLNENQPVELSPRAFANAQHLELVNLGKTKTIPDHCFDGCVNLQIFRADHVTHIGAYAFNNCRVLNLVFLERLVETDPNAFTNSEIRNFATYKIPNQFQQILPWTNRGVNLMGRSQQMPRGTITIFPNLSIVYREQQQTFRNEADENASDSLESFIEESFEEDSE